MVAFQERRHEPERREKDKYEYVCDIHGTLSNKEIHHIAGEDWCGFCVREHFLEHTIKPTQKRIKK
jgi:hypothetical protein